MTIQYINTSPWEMFRINFNGTDEEAWKAFMHQNGYKTPQEWLDYWDSLRTEADDWKESRFPEGAEL